MVSTLRKDANILGDDVPKTMESALLAFGDSDIAHILDQQGRTVPEIRLRLDIYDPALEGCHAVVSAEQGGLIVPRIEGVNIRNACRELTNEIVEKNIRQAIKNVITRGKAGEARLINGRLYPDSLPFAAKLSMKDRNDLLIKAKRASNLYCVACAALLTIVAAAVFGYIHMGVLLMAPFFLGTMAALDRRMKLDMLMGSCLGAYQSHYERADRQRRSLRNAINTAREA